MPVTATPWRMVPSTPARSAYLAWKSLVPWADRAASWAWWTDLGCTVSWRRPDAEVVHWARTGHGPQVPFGKVITIVSVPRWVTGFQELLAWPPWRPARPAPFPVGARELLIGQPLTELITHYHRQRALPLALVHRRNGCDDLRRGRRPRPRLHGHHEFYPAAETREKA